jgi:ubiquitin-protein ligase
MSNGIHKRVIKDITDGRINLKQEYGVYLEPEDGNFYNVHFVLPGPEDTPYEGGLYHGMIRLNAEHPKKPPNIHMITPNGRFMAEKQPVSTGSRGICVDFTAFHPTDWSPCHNIEKLIKAFLSMMCDDQEAHQAGGIIENDITRKKLAKNSLNEIAADKTVQELFPDLWETVAQGKYKTVKIGELGLANKPVQVECDISEDEEEEETVVKKSTKKISKKKIIEEEFSESESEEEVVVKKPIKKSAKKKIIKEESESEEEIIVKKPAKKSTKKKVTKEESESESGSESEEEPVAKKSKKILGDMKPISKALGKKKTKSN